MAHASPSKIDNLVHKARVFVLGSPESYRALFEIILELKNMNDQLQGEVAELREEVSDLNGKTIGSMQIG